MKIDSLSDGISAVAYLLCNWRAVLEIDCYELVTQQSPEENTVSRIDFLVLEYVDLAAGVGVCWFLRRRKHE